jgi:hypothetical protein
MTVWTSGSSAAGSTNAASTWKFDFSITFGRPSAA